MKKVNFILLICVLGIVLCSCGQKNSEYKDIKPEKSTKNSLAVGTQVKTEKFQISKEKVLASKCS
ncbi:hypothetical protein AN964_23255 [Heyndrickxia shackletonii]|uniref:Lipoprotein n=1 Tax=Heyndrickxia shackletonii TaxID=157838 RepID=A0A0Q3WRU6_9BACI|nr:hypothetical protein AN964_23255 [Heyndrickxia shackletonii]